MDDPNQTLRPFAVPGLRRPTSRRFPSRILQKPIRTMTEAKTNIPAETPLLSASTLVASALERLKGKNEQEDRDAVIQDLELALKVLTKLDPYLDEHSAAGPQSLQPLLKATVEEDWDARHKEGKTTFPMGAAWSAGAYEGMFVANVARAIGAKRVLEVGMFTGTTTFCIADNLPQGGKVVALELDAYLETFLSPHLERAGLREKVEVRTGAAKDSIERLVEEVKQGAIPPFDLIFIDADKTGYQGYYDQVMQGGLLKVGGVFLVDNTLYSKSVLKVGIHSIKLLTKGCTSCAVAEGSPVLASDPSAQQQLLSKVGGIGNDNAQALAKFNKNVVQDKRVEATLLPLRDGLTWINRLS